MSRMSDVPPYDKLDRARARYETSKSLFAGLVLAIVLGCLVGIIVLVSDVKDLQATTNAEAQASNASREQSAAIIRDAIASIGAQNQAQLDAEDALMLERLNLILRAIETGDKVTLPGTPPRAAVPSGGGRSPERTPSTAPAPRTRPGPQGPMGPPGPQGPPGPSGSPSPSPSPSPRPSCTATVLGECVLPR